MVLFVCLLRVRSGVYSWYTVFQKCNLFQALETSASSETARQNETTVVQPAVDTSSFDIGDITYARPRQLAEE